MFFRNAQLGQAFRHRFTFDKAAWRRWRYRPPALGWGGGVKEKRIAFACPHCGQYGEVVWRDDGHERMLVRLQEGFHVEEGRLPGAKHVIVCDACDKTDPLRSYP
jgi:hypothetical protein